MFIYKVPGVLPVVMTAWNALFVVSSFLLEGRFKVTPFMFVFLYGGTIRASLKGDMVPFFNVLCSKEFG